MYRAKLQFQDGRQLEVVVQAGQTLVDATAQASLPVRHDCLSGQCGTCIAWIAQGSIDAAPVSPQVLSPEEVSAGMVATCQTRLLSDATFTFDYPLQPEASEPSRHKGIVRAHERLNASVSRLVIELQNPDTFKFQSGQYLRLRPGNLRVARPYSIASTIGDLPLVELLIRHVPDGIVSAWLNDGDRSGEPVTVQGPLGSFARDDRAERHVFIAGGTGLAPVLSMIRDRDRQGRSKLLCFGCNRYEDLFFVKELRALEKQIPGLEVRVATMDGPHEAVSGGTALDLLAPPDFAPNTAFHLCGPPGMVSAARNTLAANSVATHAVRSERFHVSV